MNSAKYIIDSKPYKLINEYLQNKSVLVIEPAINYKISIKQFLSNLRISKIKVVNDVNEAKKTMLLCHIGFFIVEWNLKGINGIQFCRELRSHPKYRNIPFLLTSTENLRKDVILASEVGIDGYLLKPFSYEVFLAKMLHIVKIYLRPSALNNLLDQANNRLLVNDLDGAEKLFEAAKGLYPSSSRANCGLAKISLLRGNTIDAMNFLKEAIENNPDYLEAYREMIKVCETENDFETMLNIGLKLHTMSPENPKYTIILAKVYLEMGRLDKSEEFFKKTIRLSPKIIEAFKGLGIVYMQKKEYENAMKNFTKALDLDKDDISTLNSLGLSYVRMGKIKEGINKYVIALQMDPENPKILFNIGYAYEKLNNLYKAQEFYSKAVKVNPDFEKAKRALARVSTDIELSEIKSELTKKDSSQEQNQALEDFLDVS